MKLKWSLSLFVTVSPGDPASQPEGDARLRRLDSAGSQKGLVQNDVLRASQVEYEATVLKKKLGLISGASLIVGTMIGESAKACHCGFLILV